MPASHHIDNDTRIIFTRWQGKATDDELIDALKRYQETILSRPEYSDFCEIVDFRDALLFSISIGGIKRVGRQAASMDHTRSCNRLAFLVNSKMGTNLVKLYALYRNFGRHRSGGKQIRAFTTESDAIAWLQKMSP